MQRVHPLIPTEAEIAADPELAYSHSVPILVNFKMAGANGVGVPVLSYDVHLATREIEGDYQLAARYQRILQGLQLAVKELKTPLILLQGAVRDTLSYRLQDDFFKETKWWQVELPKTDDVPLVPDIAPGITDAVSVPCDQFILYDPQQLEVVGDATWDCELNRFAVTFKLKANGETFQVN
ncbi:MAG: hypothetical protein ACHQJ6_09355, partial [Candidatus Berkiellales bacterium]